MPQGPLFSEYYPSRLPVPVPVPQALDKGRRARSHAAYAVLSRLRAVLTAPFRRRQTVAVPPSGIRVVVCNDC